MTTLESCERANLRRFIMEHFNLGELKCLAFDLGVEYQVLAYKTLQEFALELVAYFERRDQLYNLVAEVLKQRLKAANDALVLLLPKLRPVSPNQKVVIIIDHPLWKPVDPAELKKDISRKFGVPEDGISVIATAGESLLLLVGLPQEPAQRLAQSNIRYLGQYRIRLTTLYDSLDYTSQMAWHRIAIDWQPLIEDNMLIPAVSWQRMVEHIQQELGRGAVKLLQLPVLMEPMPASAPRDLTTWLWDARHDYVMIDRCYVQGQQYAVIPLGSERVALTSVYDDVLVPVIGDSMNLANINEGDFALVHLLREEDNPVNDDIVAAEVYDESQVVLRRFIVRGSRYYLQALSSNPEWQDYQVEIGDVRKYIRGIATAVLKPVGSE